MFIGLKGTAYGLRSGPLKFISLNFLKWLEMAPNVLHHIKKMPKGAKKVPKSCFKELKVRNKCTKNVPKKCQKVTKRYRKVFFKDLELRNKCTKNIPKKCQKVPKRCLKVSKNI